MKAASMRIQLCAVAVAGALAAVSGAASAGFMDDFYSQSGSAQLNVTKAGVVQSATLNTATGGGFVYKTSRSTFNPFFFTPPSLKAGCGGIDLMLGSFSLPSEDDFVAFLRNIGQALPGVAFELALKSLSPEFAGEVKSYWQFLVDLSQKNIDACQAASAILEKTEASNWIKGTVRDAEAWARSTGVVSDQRQAQKTYGADGGKAIADKQKQYNPLGELVDGAQVNLVWIMLNKTQYGSASPVALKEMIMSLLGTTVYRADGTGPDQQLFPVSYERKLGRLSDLMGTVDSATFEAGKVQIYSCGTDTAECLTPTVSDVSEKPFAYRVYQAALKYHQAIITRDASQLDYDELYLIATNSSIPLLRIVGSVTNKRYPWVATDVIATFSEAVAYEMVGNMMASMAADAERLLDTSLRTAKQAVVADQAKQLKEDLRALQREIQEASRQVDARMRTQAAMLQTIDHIERALKGNLAADIAANMAFQRR